MIIGIGGAGSKIATKLDAQATIINVSDTELRKIPTAGRRIQAVVHAEHGQFRGSRKNPAVGYDAYLSVRRELQELARGGLLFSSTGGGTGSGITTGLLRDLARRDSIPESDKTSFALILPYAPLEPAEYVRNTIEFLRGPLSEAIDSGNTGNIFLFSNQVKFESRLAEDAFNAMIVESLRVFLSVPDKNDTLRLLDGHIDPEDFALYVARPYFNHFTAFEYDPAEPFARQLEEHFNPLLLAPDVPIEALFLVEVPAGGDPTVFYSVLQHFNEANVSPVYSVVENPARERPFVTVSLLYSRKPAELLADFNKRNEQHAQAKVRKSLEQYVDLPRLDVNLEREAKRAARQRGADEDILQVLKRIGKL